MAITKTEDFLREAMTITNDRNKTHGDRVVNHGNISQLWSWYLKKEVTAYDVAMMMALLKMARTKLGEVSKDTYIDMSAYSAIAGEIKFKEK